jgi:hypothetical protein
MLIRRSFDTDLTLESSTAPAASGGRDWVIDWRWFSTPTDDDTALPSEHSLIDCAPWAKPKRPRHA